MGTKWLEEGEQKSHYFFNLEKQHSSNNNINRLNINGVIKTTKQYLNTVVTFTQIYTALSFAKHQLITS